MANRRKFQTISVALHTGGALAVTLINTNLMAWGEAERALVVAIADAMRAYRPTPHVDPSDAPSISDLIDDFGSAVIANAALPLDAPDDPAVCPEMRRELEARAALVAAASATAAPRVA